MKLAITTAAVALAAGAVKAGPTFVSKSDQGSVNARTFEAIDFTGGINDIYDYSNFQFDGSGNGALFSQSDLMQDKLNVFLVNTTDDGLAAFFVFDNGLPDNEPGSGTSANNADGTLSFQPSPPDGDQSLLFEDDSSDTSLQVGSSNDPFDFDFDWANGFTDGLVSTFAIPADTLLRIELTSFKGIDGFNLIGANNSWLGLFDDAGGVVDGPNDYLEIQFIPMPHPAAMATVGVIGVAGLRRRR